MCRYINTNFDSKYQLTGAVVTGSWRYRRRKTISLSGLEKCSIWEGPGHTTVMKVMKGCREVPNTGPDNLTSLNPQGFRGRRAAYGIARVRNASEIIKAIARRIEVGGAALVR